MLLPFELKTCDGRVLVIDRVREEETDEVCNFVYEHFLKSKPNRFLIPYDGCSAETFHQRRSGYLKSVINQSVSFSVRDPSVGGELAAVRINELKHRNEPKQEDQSTEKEMSPWERRPIIAFLKSLNEGINLFDQYNVDTILHLAMVAVSSDYGRLGLASELYKLSIEIGQNVGAGAIVTEAVSVYAAKAAASFGLQTLREVVYEEFQLEDGSKPYAPVIKELGDHCTGKLMARSLKME